MAQPYSTGAVLAYVTFPGGTTAFVGTGKRYPRLRVRREWEPVYNDISGKVPLDVAYEGQESLVSITFTRWNAAPLRACMSMPNAAGIPGANTFGDMGSLMVQERLGLGLSLVFPYSAKAAYATQEPGWRFPVGGTYLEGPDEHEPMGTTPREITVMFHSIPQYDASLGRFILFDFNVAGLPIVAPD